MAFWSSQTLAARVAELTDPPVADDAIDCNAITLRVGREIYITPELEDAHVRTKQELKNNQGFLIPPGQFAFVMTEETVKVPRNAMAFISMKATFKMKGLINVSGFHADPGWVGSLVFAVFNAGPAPVHLHQGLPLFLIWFADLDHVSEKSKNKPGFDHIPAAIINTLTGGINSLHALDKRVTEETDSRHEEISKLNDRVHSIEKSQRVIYAVASAIAALAIGIFGRMLFH